MNKKIILPLIIFFAGLILGSIYFFPWNFIKDSVEESVAKNTPLNIRFQKLKAGTGLSIGVGRGSVFALHGIHSKIRMANGMELHCDRLIMAPGILSLFTGNGKIGFACENSKEGNLLGSALANPFWAPKELDIETELVNRDLSFLKAFMGGSRFEGRFNGSLNIENLPLEKSSAKPDLSWDLKGKNVQSPEFNSPYVKLPAIDMGPLKLLGSYKKNRLDLKKLHFGSSKSNMQTEMKIDFTFNKQFIPQSGGTWSGWIRVVPEFEESALKSISLSMFGKADSRGKRIFKKTVKGGPLSLLGPPD